MLTTIKEIRKRLDQFLRELKTKAKDGFGYEGRYGFVYWFRKEAYKNHLTNRHSEPINELRIITGNLDF